MHRNQIEDGLCPSNRQPAVACKFACWLRGIGWQCRVSRAQLFSKVLTVTTMLRLLLVSSSQKACWRLGQTVGLAEALVSYEMTTQEDGTFGFNFHARRGAAFVGCLQSFLSIPGSHVLATSGCRVLPRFFRMVWPSPQDGWRCKGAGAPRQGSARALARSSAVCQRGKAAAIASAGPSDRSGSLRQKATRCHCDGQACFRRRATRRPCDFLLWCFAVKVWGWLRSHAVRAKIIITCHWIWVVHERAASFPCFWAWRTGCTAFGRLSWRMAFCRVPLEKSARRRPK